MGSAPKKGLAQFFCKASKEEKIAYQKREMEKQRESLEDAEYEAQRIEMERKARKRETDRIRQQQYHKKLKGLEVQKRVHSPGGMKRKVRCNTTFYIQ